MGKRRPVARDRDVTSWVESLSPGSHRGNATNLAVPRVLGRRPRARDRNVASWFDDVIDFQIDVTDESTVNPMGARYLGLAPLRSPGHLKREGGMIINPWGPKIIEIYPVES